MLLGLLALGCAASAPGRAPGPGTPGCDAACRAERLCLARRGRLPPRPFRSDGCSLFPDGGWRACCERHDMDYWCGGSLLDRLHSDLALARCVGRPPLGMLMFLGVRLGGSFLLPTPWRWGFGHPYLRGTTWCTGAQGGAARGPAGVDRSGEPAEAEGGGNTPVHSGRQGSGGASDAPPPTGAAGRALPGQGAGGGAP